MKILVTGDRHWTDNDLVQVVLAELVLEAGRFGETLEVVHGDARGADRIAGAHARLMGLVVHAHPAQWSAYGRAAGPVRNREMLAEHPDISLVVAFHADIAHSRGTRDMVTHALKRGFDVRLFPEGQDVAALRPKPRKRQAELF